MSEDARVEAARMKIVSDHGFLTKEAIKQFKQDCEDALAAFKNERDYIAQAGRLKTTVAAMDWASLEIERLRAAHLSPDTAAAVETERYLVWSNEHRAWWRPNAQGYTMFLDAAGRYTRDEAIKHSMARGNPTEPPPEIPVRESDVLAAAIREGEKT